MLLQSAKMKCGLYISKFEHLSMKGHYFLSLTCVKTYYKCFVFLYGQVMLRCRQVYNSARLNWSKWQKFTFPHSWATYAIYRKLIRSHNYKVALRYLVIIIRLIRSVRLTKSDIYATFPACCSDHSAHSYNAASQK
jgi:hypothetical protein